MTQEDSSEKTVKKMRLDPDSHKIDGFIRSIPYRFAILIAFVVGFELAFMKISEKIFQGHLPDAPKAGIEITGMSGIFALSCWYLVLKPLLSTLRKDQALLLKQKNILEDHLRELHINKKLARGFALAESESNIISFFKRAVEKVLPGIPVELLLVDSSQTHLRLATTTVDSISNKIRNSEKHDESNKEAVTPFKKNLLMCNVSSPKECPATRQGIPMVFKDSRDLETCPFLVQRSERALCSICIPISAGGRTVGLIHSDFATNDIDIESIKSTFSDISDHLGTRLGLVRALEEAQRAAMKDPLTGLLNRRSLENVCETLLLSKREFSIVIADIDHFKKLNDTYSHAVGDRSLKVFANTLHKCCRGGDVLARLGGEEFCMIYLDVTAERAIELLERVRENLPVFLSQAGLPIFTASFGVTDTNFGDSLEVLLKISDDLMYEAKKAGRNQIKTTTIKLEKKPVLTKIGNASSTLAR